MSPRGLSGMAACDPRAYFGASVFGPVGPAATERADRLQRGLPQTLLALVLVGSQAVVPPEPIPGDLLEELRHALLSGASGLLQLALEAGREPPAIDLGLHASHCSAGAAGKHHPTGEVE